MGKLTVLLLVSSVMISAALPAYADPNTLRNLGKQIDLQIGTAGQGRDWLRSKEAKLIAKEFGLVTVFTFPKLIQPQTEGVFEWRAFDHQLAFAREHNLRLYGHALIYKQSTLPSWMSTKPWSPDELEAVMRQFIQPPIKRGGDQFYGWVVVNEPFTYRNQPWHSAFGREGYVKLAFRLARESASDQKLVLNESYGQSGIDESKAKRVFDLVEALRKDGVMIDALGVEMHLEMAHLRSTYADEFSAFVARAETTNIDIHVTEMDVDDDGRAGRSGSGIRQEEVFARVASICAMSPRCKVFALWGTCDYRSWIRARVNKPNRNSRPLIFDDECRPKESYFAIRNVLEKAAAGASEQ